MAVSLELAISAIKAGRKDEGRQLLNLLIQQNPNNENAWLWMSSVVQSDEQRARCLYHVLAINPNNAMARKGLSVLGIVVSDSRPVKIPRDSQPIKIPKPSTADQTGPAEPSQERRPFLIDPQTVTQELPFAPLNPPFKKIQASPAILAIDVEQAAHTEAVKASSAVDPAEVNNIRTQNLPLPGDQLEDTPAELVLVLQDEAAPVPAATGANGGTAKEKKRSKADRYETKTQKMPSPFEQPQAIPKQPAVNATAAQKSKVASQPAKAKQGNTATPPAKKAVLQSGTGLSQDQQDESRPVPNDTRPSRPVQLAGMSLVATDHNPYFANQSPPLGHHSQFTMGMPNQPYAQPPSQVYVMPPPLHSNPTMSMPTAYDYRPPSEPVPAIHSSATLGMNPFGQPQYQPGPQALAFHSSATMLMPTMSEAEARARLNGSQAIPVANGLAMPLQSGNWQSTPYHVPQATYMDDFDEDEGQGNDEINVLAVIIFGTLSLTAMGGLGMLVLLIFTTPA